jgi:hypothetical protein
MKKAVFFVLLFALAMSGTINAATADPKATVDPKTVAVEYQGFTAAYYENRAAAQACDKAGDTTCAVARFLIAELAAKNHAERVTKTATDTVDWQAIADWQRNNAAYCLIQAQADGDKRDPVLLKEALAILEARPITSAEVKDTAKKNADYCKTQLADEPK